MTEKVFNLRRNIYFSTFGRRGIFQQDNYYFYSLLGQDLDALKKVFFPNIIPLLRATGSLN
jgi:hypothetical protein